MLPFTTPFSSNSSYFPFNIPLSSLFLLLFSSFSLQKKKPLMGTIFHWSPHSCSPRPLFPILHTVFPACLSFAILKMEAECSHKTFAFCKTIQNHIPEAILWTLMTAPKLAILLSYSVLLPPFIILSLLSFQKQWEKVSPQLPHINTCP
jgi:hypothetical protein